VAASPLTRLVAAGSDGLIDSQSEYGRALCERLHLESRDLPALITPSGMPLRHPSVREVARVAGLLRPLAGEEESEIACDLAIVGAGPAGLAAAVYAASEGLKTVVLESYAPGGQAGSSSLIENFFGFPTGISGGELTSLLPFSVVPGKRPLWRDCRN